ncbi:NAD-dependent epimerase/dehydratase family protein [Bacillus pseudomycoides]|uniref:Epimerase n=1 Tax=Bacillus pseudomycoides TaxID=64104 RepID=A0A2C3XSJ6_9BACI|nr:NAD-dependent epimerase/dehydratase family protein [Bacillus pseudomycoides]PDY46208.1 epimerase [Bacillus pseudomycoides]PEA84935.1 epimerase [Bacillus pseudomycoides]PED73275.1 epimerase [Bacillus pseudomycoides]PEI44541.1 epimerase [Bacillus pseudomycoides]PEJ81135.1 epimerase [Bacillus pseudomycoides]
MMKILVLGGTRFFGKRLVESLLQAGHDVTIATRGLKTDSFGSAVKRVVVDQEDEEMLKEMLAGASYDVVYDNLCYSPNAAKVICKVLHSKVKKYIVTSSMAVYESALSLKEDDFNPYQYPIVYGDRQDFSYSEGKRLAEAVLFKHATFPVIAVRFPVVIDENDYTKRLQFYVENIVKRKPFVVEDIEGKMSFIYEKEAGDFLAYLSTMNIDGPINACSNGVISMREVIHFVEKNTGIKACIEAKGENMAPYNGMENCTINNTKAKELGFQFRNLDTDVNGILKYYIEVM